MALLCGGFLLLSLALLAASSPLPGENPEAGPADQFNLQIMMGNEVVSPNINFNEVMMKGVFSSERLHTRPDRPGDSTEDHDCDRIQAVPRHLTFITRYNFYRKYTHAYGIPIVSSYTPSDAALKRACYVLRFMLGDRRILRHFLYKYYGRIGIIATTEVTRTIPEHSFLPPWWDQRARGLGGTIAVPISTGAEENLLCLQSDRYHAEDIFLHEFSHGIHEIAVRGGGIPGHWDRLVAHYNDCKRTGLWRNTYAMSTPQELWAEAVQSFFNVNDYANPPNGVHGPISTRVKLRPYDPVIYRLITEVFPCQNYVHDRCKRGTPPPFKMNCDGDGDEVVVTHTPEDGKVPPTLTPTSTTTTTTVPSMGVGQIVGRSGVLGWAVCFISLYFMM